MEGLHRSWRENIWEVEVDFPMELIYNDGMGKTNTGEQKMADNYKYRVVIDGEVSEDAVNEFRKFGIDFFRIVRNGRVVTKTSVIADPDVPQVILESLGVENRLEELLWN